ncbi:ParB/RepB/Spo0J family partition protein [Neoaquamicrobium sediminum]|uniref:ParB/RepB/Spo0J family partition protein n=1 Tax=Neoaquamicrobium sediminum TaxID=1849104 RepID=UPI0015650D66|nr:ParB/RepB/Spo0J family partition protein [Mesorhizobium sediminum]NRC53011.1 ParB N-terminal domain-containing protein [Mesorhizobium sediminum]
MTETLSIPLNKLVLWDGNVRKTGVSDGIEELCASIAAHGLLQAPIVRKTKGGKYAVVAGQRRLLALKQLAEKGSIASDAEIPCQLVAINADAGEISLVENVVRVAMHPADQFEAFRDLVDRGLSADAVARRFGVSEAVVTKRLKLGRLSPVILEAYRNGDIDLEAAQAFAISDDHTAQERVFGDLPEWNRSARLIRSVLTEDEIAVSDKRVQFVGLHAYEEAGGLVRRDLFDDSHSGTILDPVLLDRLVTEKLVAIADGVRAEGWAWVEIMPTLDRTVLTGYRRTAAEQVPLTDEQQAEIDALTAEYDELADSAEADEGDESVLARLDDIQARLDAIEAQQERWSDDVLASAGAIVSVGWGGDVAVERGLMRGDDAVDPEVAEQPVADVVPSAGLPATLITDLTARRTAALQATAAGNVSVMVAAVVHALALRAFYRFAHETCVKLSVEVASPERSMGVPEACAAVQRMADSHRAWNERLPEDPVILWNWCLQQPQGVLLELLAHIGALSIDAIRLKGDRIGSARLAHADALAEAIGFDIADHYVPDVPTYFGRVSSAQIVSALCEAKGTPAAPAWSRMKKAELAALAAREVAGTGWLPEVLRARDPLSDSLDNAA